MTATFQQYILNFKQASGTSRGILKTKDTWFIMTNKKGKITSTIASEYSLRNWIEYAFKQVKNELGWSDFRVTDYHSIERWWELVMSSYLLVSIQANYFQLETVTCDSNTQDSTVQFSDSFSFSQHSWWETGQTWKSSLNNLRLIIQPLIFFNLLQPWLSVFPNRYLQVGLSKLVNIMNRFRASPSLKNQSLEYSFSAA